MSLVNRLTGECGGRTSNNRQRTRYVPSRRDDADHPQRTTKNTTTRHTCREVRAARRFGGTHERYPDGFGGARLLAKTHQTIFRSEAASHWTRVRLSWFSEPTHPHSCLVHAGSGTDRANVPAKRSVTQRRVPRGIRQLFELLRVRRCRTRGATFLRRRPISQGEDVQVRRRLRKPDISGVRFPPP